MVKQSTTKSKRKTKVFLTPKQRVEVVRLKNKGETVKELAAAYNVSINTIRGICRSSVRKPRTEVTAAMADEMLELRIAGKTYQQIADLLGIAEATVSRHINKLGDPMKAHVGKKVAEPARIIHTDDGPYLAHPLTDKKGDDLMEGLKITLGIAAVIGLVLLALGQAGVLS
jgi:DNA-binding CsgD family transcriptional regulator